MCCVHMKYFCTKLLGQSRISYFFKVFFCCEGGFGARGPGSINMVSFLKASHVDQGLWVHVPPQKVQEKRGCMRPKWPCEPLPNDHPHRPGWQQQTLCSPSVFQMQRWVSSLNSNTKKCFWPGSKKILLLFLALFLVTKFVQSLAKSYHFF